MMVRHFLRSLVTLTAAGVLVVSGAGLASADVSVTTSDATPGSTTVVDFAVSDLRPDSPTTRVEITMPAGSAFTTLVARPKIGWDTALVRPPGATSGPVASVVWTLTDDRFAIAPGAFDVFSLQVGPLPPTGSLVFPAAQTYRNQMVDAWAPTLTRSVAAVPAVTAAPAPPPPKAKEAEPDNRGRVVVGLAAGAVLILLAVMGAGFGGRKPDDEPAAPAEPARVEV